MLRGARGWGWRDQGLGAGMGDFDLVIFDCDGVLVDSEKISAAMLIAELGAMGITVDMPYVARHFLGRSYPVVMSQIRRDFGIDLPEGFEEAYRNRLLAAFSESLTAMPGVARVLSGLRLPWCVATSSSPRRVEASLRMTGLWDLARGRVFTASEVANGKPAPDLFLHAAARMGASPARSLVIEDSLTGIRAGRAAGMIVWRFTGGSHLGPVLDPEPEDARPNLHFASFTGFFDLLPQAAPAPPPPRKDA